MRMFKKDEGFTLVELMVVVLIIGILVAIAIPVFNSASESARKRTCQANQRTIAGAVQQFVAAGQGNTVAETDGVVDASNILVAGGNNAAGTFVNDPYVKTAPSCSSTGGSTYFLDTGTVTGDTGAAAWAVADHVLP